METVEFANVIQKLMYVQQNLKAPKGQYNQFGDYHYRSCEDIQEALKPLLHQVKAVLLLNDELVQMGERFYIKAVAVFQDAESKESISNSAYARECESRPKMDAAQITGSCSSYARKYALNGLFCIDDAKDPDMMGSEASDRQQDYKRQQASMQSPKLKAEYQRKLKGEAERTGTDLKKVCDRYKVRDISDLTNEQYQRAMSAFSKMESLPPPAEEEQITMFMDIDKYAEEFPFR